MSESAQNKELLPEGIVQLFHKEFADAYNEIGRFNLAVFGKTGSGKSTLINAVFGQTVAPTGIGRPVTKGLNYYLHSNGFLGVFDSEGFETGTSGDSILAGLERIVQTKNSEPIDQRIHAVWYLVRWSDRRFENAQADFIRALRAMGLPVIIVMTQVPAQHIDGEFVIHPDAIEFAHYIESLNIPTQVNGTVYLTNALADPFLQSIVFGLVELVGATHQVIPEAVANALTAAQQVDVRRKKEAAAAVIKQAALVSGGIGAVPIPIADAALLVPNQVAMIARITAIYGLPQSRSRALSIAGAAILTGGATQAGRYAVTQLLRFIPGGQIAGSAISATVAASLTRAIGIAWSRVCEYALTLSPSDQSAFLKERVKDQFLTYLGKNR
jgi:uncharacterized protein (DUF697 family)/GTP-binding protein EngB required for normal cell division